MNINSAFPSSYLKAADFNGKRVRLTMRTVTMETMQSRDGTDEKKPVLYFSGTDKGLVLNKTNAAAIAEMYGPETDDWAGKQIVLYPTKVDMGGRMVDGIRVYMAPPAEEVADHQSPLHTDAAPPATSRPVPSGNGHVAGNGYAAAKAEPGRTFNDEIPF